MVVGGVERRRLGPEHRRVSLERHPHTILAIWEGTVSLRKTYVPSDDTHMFADPGAPTLAEVWALIREDYAMHSFSMTKPGFRALLVYRLNAWRLTLRSRPLRMPLTVVGEFAFRFVRNRYGIEFPPTCKIGRRLVIYHNGGIVVHRYGVIGHDCVLLHGVTLGATNGVSRDSGPTLGNGVKLGTDAKVIGGVSIGDGATIGPNAVVMMDVPPGAVAFAPAARLIFPTAPAGQQSA
jgi:serine O-acetyltransferase